MYKTLGKKFTGVAQVTRLFLIGFKDFAKDARIYIGIKAKVLLKSDHLKKLSRQELEVYYRWPSDCSKLFPTLAISALPFANYVVIPIAYYYPKYLLSSHFWTPDQKNMFHLEDLRRKRQYYGPVMQFLQAHGCFIAEDSEREAFERILRKVESRVPVTVDEIVQVRDSFCYRPFSLEATSNKHVNTLSRMHGMHAGVIRTRTRLWKTAQMIQTLDFAIQREGTADMKLDDLRMACYLRGFDGANKSGDDMNQFISQWVAVTTTLTPKAYSLILHLPIFLCYHNDWRPKI